MSIAILMSCSSAVPGRMAAFASCRCTACADDCTRRNVRSSFYTCNAGAIHSRPEEKCHGIIRIRSRRTREGIVERGAQSRLINH